MSNTTTLPVVHLNGTNRAVLLGGYEKAYEALYAALQAMSEVEFNARDYYINGTWDRAVDERSEALKKLRDVAAHVYAHVEHLTELH